MNSIFVSIYQFGFFCRSIDYKYTVTLIAAQSKITRAIGGSRLLHYNMPSFYMKFTSAVATAFVLDIRGGNALSLFTCFFTVYGCIKYSTEFKYIEKITATAPNRFRMFRDI